LGNLLHFCQDAETGHRAASTLPDRQAEPLAQPDPEVFAQLIRSVRCLSEIACLIEDAHARLPDGPEKEQFDRWRHDIITHIYEAMSRVERLVASFPRKTIADSATNAHHV
jgi:hypothetical protein